MEPWKWVEGGVEIDGQAHALPPMDRAAARRLIGELNQSAELFEVLSLGKVAFSNGRAAYEDAAANLSHLLTELQKAQLRWLTAFDDLCRAFAPPVRAEAIDSADRTRFAFETILKIDAKLMEKS